MESLGYNMSPHTARQWQPSSREACSYMALFNTACSIAEDCSRQSAYLARARSEPNSTCSIPGALYRTQQVGPSHHNTGQSVNEPMFELCAMAFYHWNGRKELQGTAAKKKKEAMAKPPPQ
ncbi:hypothetical protein M431DRAFT_482136 [Trichoderma harzianum CBS 226.95]|uniref:Uncharacterized protein n=1 Tax=Trichoderma harzianum CBS 226.95 TaxID=983964 RepID=A0A2T4AD02_TRIHA|nr:hypothetical protein M431DRAFT_482136 [Trichoderma harzianum CBS 226.95]PTB54964.1 hypothetical protein M431DRAFT_482136 [Trichoderma harzianum CBS 226.95]